MKEYFSNLDPLRFVAILFIFTVHFFFIIPLSGLEFAGIPLQNIAFNIGETGFTFFCVLSGFLNAYLIMAEMGRKQGQINVKKFYIRRILRIWPLYFAFILFFLGIFPHLNERFFHLHIELPSPFYFIFYLVNFKIDAIQDDALPVYSNLWTISLEEQFYVFLPWVLLFFKGRYNWLYAILLSIFIVSNYLLFPEFEKFFFHTLCLTSDFCIGIFLAHQANSGSKFFTWFKQWPWWARMLPYALVLVIFFFSHFGDLLYTTSPNLFIYIAEKLILGMALGMIIMDQCFSTRAIFRLGEYRYLVYLGQISFGLYIFHDLGIFLGCRLVFSDDFYFPGIIGVAFVASLLIAIAFAIISYHCFEKYFLKWKEKFY